ncbi:MAG: hypothetical protein ABF260_09560 [Flavobacteriaceae bacterium]
MNFLLLGGYNTKAVLALSRYFSLNKLSFCVIASDKKDPILQSIYIKNVSFVRKTKELDLDTFKKFSNNISFNGETVLMPTSEFLIRFYLDNIDFFNELSIIMPVCNKDLYLKLSDKYSFSMECIRFKINVPRELDKVKVRPPFVIKSKRYLPGFSPILIHSSEEYDKYNDLKFKTDDFFYQEFIQGESFYLLGSINKNGKISVNSQQNLIQEPFGGSIVSAILSDYHLSSDAKEYLNLLIENKYYGFFMIEVRKSDDNSFYAIEVNPRLWGPLQLLVDNDTSILCNILEDYGFKIKPKIRKKTKPYFRKNAFETIQDLKILCDFDIVKYQNNDLLTRNDIL